MKRKEKHTTILDTKPSMSLNFIHNNTKWIPKRY